MNESDSFNIHGDYRVSLRKTFWRRITKEDFIRYVERFRVVFASVCGSVDTEIKLYTRVPHFTSFMLTDEEYEFEKQMNEEGMQMLKNLEDLPRDISKRGYVQVTITPQQESSSPDIAWVTIGKLLPGHILFHAQCGKVAQAMEKEMFPDNRAPRGFKLGDGFEENSKR